MAHQITIEGVRFSLRLDAADKPYVLRQFKREGWTIVWAEWHKGLPTGLRKRALAALGFEWRNDNPETLGWHRI